MLVNFQEKIKQQVADKLGIINFEKSAQDKIVSNLLNVIVIKTNIAIFEKLENAEREKFSKFLKVKDKSIAMDYLSAKIKNLPELVEKITSETIGEFKELSKNYENK